MAEADPTFRTDDVRPAHRIPDSAIAAPLAILTTILGLILLAWVVLFVTKGRFLKHTFERIVSSSLQRQVRVAGDFQLYFDPIDTKLVAEGLTIANPAWRRGQFFKSDRIDSRIATLPLLFGNRRVKWLSLSGATLDLAWDQKHQRNSFTFGDPNRKGEPFEMPDIRRAEIAGTRVAYSDPLMRLTANIQIDTIRAANTQLSDDIRFHGGGTLRDNPFTLTGSLQSPNETIGGGANKLVMHAEAAGNTRLDVSGTLPGATVIEGADLAVRARGDNIRDLFDFIGVAVPETRTYDLRSHLTKTATEYRFTRLTGRFGDSDIAGVLTVSMPNQRVLLVADLRTQRLDIIDAGPFLGYDPRRIAKSGDRGIITQVAGTPRVLPDAPLRIDAIKAFDARVKYHVATVRAESFPVSNIGLVLDLDHSLLKLSPLTFDVAGGHLWSDISINARVPQVFTAYDIKLSPTPMGKLLGRFGVEESGTSGTISARIRMTGTGDSVRRSLATSNGRIAVVIPQGTFWTRNIQLAELDLGTYFTKLLGNKLKKPVEINCGLVAFTVRNGIAAADPILIDTTKNVIIGRGGFSFRTEAIDLAFRADGKTFSLFSAQSPVGLNGYFAKQGIQVISPQLLTRAGIGLGLSIVGTPLAGVLAFVDIGDAHSAQCGPILSGATANAQRTKNGKPRDDVGHGTTAKSETGRTTHDERSKQRHKFLGIF